MLRAERTTTFRSNKLKCLPPETVTTLWNVPRRVRRTPIAGEFCLGATISGPSFYAMRAAITIGLKKRAATGSTAMNVEKELSNGRGFYGTV